MSETVLLSLPLPERLRAFDEPTQSKSETEMTAETKRTFNFSAGPAVLPESVIREAQIDLWDFAGTGIGILEQSHRGKAFAAALDSRRQRPRTCPRERKPPCFYKKMGGAFGL